MDAKISSSGGGAAAFGLGGGLVIFLPNEVIRCGMGMADGMEGVVVGIAVAAAGSGGLTSGFFGC